MSDFPEASVPPQGQFLVYAAEDGRVKIDVRLEDETVWLTQRHMADLFQTSPQNIGQHLKNIFAEGELLQNSVVKKFFITAADGKHYHTNFYSLDAIISVGYRVKSAVATRFRIWATVRGNLQEILAGLTGRILGCQRYLDYYACEAKRSIGEGDTVALYGELAPILHV